jgi:hypothetical protein
MPRQNSVVHPEARSSFVGIETRYDARLSRLEAGKRPQKKAVIARRRSLGERRRGNLDFLLLSPYRDFCPYGALKVY